MDGGDAPSTQRGVLTSILFEVPIVSVVIGLALWLAIDLSPVHHQNWKVTHENYGLYAYIPDGVTVPTKILAVYYVCLGAAMTVTEALVGGKERRLIRALGFLGVILEMFFIVDALTNLIKHYIAEPRPLYISVCAPGVPFNELKFNDGDGSIICSPGVTRKELDPVQVSFPSGHASASFSISVFCMIYAVFVFKFRLRSRVPRKYMPVYNTSEFCAVAGPFVIATYIAASRVHDYKHSPADIAAGALLGTLGGAVFAGRAIYDLVADARKYNYEFVGRRDSELPTGV